MSTANKKQLAYGPTEGPLQGFRVTDGKVTPEAEEYLKKEKEQSLLAKQTEEGPSPVAMGLLQLGASMMRDEGWKNSPVTLGQSIGKAIPQGIAGYYNQDIMNKNEEAAVYETRKAEALLAKTASDKKTREDAFGQYVDDMDEDLFNTTGKIKPDRVARMRKALKDRFAIDPKDAWEDIQRKEDKRDLRNKPEQFGDSEAIANQRRNYKGIIQEVEDNTFITEADKKAFLLKWGTQEPENMRANDLYLAGQEARKLIGETAEKSTLMADNLAYKEGIDTIFKDNESLDGGSTLSPEESQELDFIMNSVKDPIKQMEDLRVFKATAMKKRMPTEEIQTGTGESIAALVADKQVAGGLKLFEGLDPKAYYNYKVNPDGSVNIISAKPGLRAKYTTAKANSLITLMNGLNIIGPQDVAKFNKSATDDPATTMELLKKMMADSLADTIGKDPREGSILKGKDIKAKDKDGKFVKVTGLKDESNYFFNKTKGTYELLNPSEFKDSVKLSGMWDQQAGLYTQSLNAYNGLITAFNDSLNNEDGAGVSDMTMLRAFLIMLEPNSVVRESEFATAAQAQGAYENLKNMIKRVENGAFLSAKGRRAYLNAARSYMSTVQVQYDKQRQHFLDLAEVNKISPLYIVDAFKDKEGNSIVKGLVDQSDRKDLTKEEWKKLWDNEAFDYSHGQVEPEGQMYEDPTQESKLTGSFGGGIK